MKFAMHEITTRDGSFPEHLAAYAATGWKHFEINLWHAGKWIEANGVEAAARLVKDHGLTCVGATGLGVNATEPEAAKEVKQALQQYGEIMQALGCRPLVCGGGGPVADLSRANYGHALDTLAAHLQDLAAVAEPYGVQLAVEVNWMGLCRSFSTAADLVQRTNRPNVGVVWDPAHFYSTPSRLSDLKALQGHILHAHCDDMKPCPVEVCEINGDRVIPGEGILPLREWLDTVTACGYQGYHCVELFNEELWARDLTTICCQVKDGVQRAFPDAEF